MIIYSPSIIFIKIFKKRINCSQRFNFRDYFLKDLKTVKIDVFGHIKKAKTMIKQGHLSDTGYFTSELNNYKFSYKTDIFDFYVLFFIKVLH